MSIKSPEPVTFRSREIQSNLNQFIEMAALLGSWGECPGCPADLNGDGEVGPVDLAALLGAWGPCP